MVYPDAVRSEDDIKRITDALPGVLVNIDMGFGVRARPTTPLISLPRLKELGVARASMPRMMSGSALMGMKKALEVMRHCIETGEIADRPDLLVGIEDITELVGYGASTSSSSGFCWKTSSSASTATRSATTSFASRVSGVEGGDGGPGCRDGWDGPSHRCRHRNVDRLGDRRRGGARRPRAGLSGPADSNRQRLCRGWRRRPAGAGDPAQGCELLGQQVIIDYKTGAGGNLAMESVARAAPDGYTLLLGTPGLAINPGLYKTLSFDPLKDFAPVALIGVVQNVLVVNPSLRRKACRS